MSNTAGRAAAETRATAAPETTTRSDQAGAGARDQAGAEARLEHYRDRIRHLGEVIDAASCDRELAMFRAHQLGMTIEQVARLALADPAAARHSIDLLSQEPDVNEWGDGPAWAQCYPKTCW